MSSGATGIVRSAAEGRVRRLADPLLAVLLLVVAVPSVVAGKPGEGPLVLTLPVAAAFAVAVGIRSRWPLVAVAVVTVAGLAQGLGGQSPGNLWAFAALLLVAVAAGQHLPDAPAVAGLALLVVGLWVQEWQDGGEDYLFILLVFGGAWLLGRGLRAWQGRAHSAEQHQRDLARLAVAEERVRIARELHDVVAHGLSVIAVQADAAEAALGSDPSRAQAPLRAIQGSARDALAEMRQLLALLRTDADDSSAEPATDAELSPVRGLADLPALVDATRQAGLELDSMVDLPPGAQLPPGLQLAVYRIVQEGLTNVVKHAGAASTRLRVCREGDALVVRVENDPGEAVRAPARHPGSGHGLVGIRERVQALGGDSGAGPTPQDGFLLWARLPVDGTR